jgi:uncharacterized membrane protein YfcA
MLYNADFWYLALPVIFIGYFMFGVSGFGASLITVPLLSHVAAPAQLLPVLVVLDISAALILGTRFRADMARNEVKLLIPFTVVGAALGVTLLVRLPRDALMIAIGVFTLFYAAYQLYDPVNVRPISRLWAAPAGFVGGMMGTLFGAGSPPYVMYLTRRVAEKAALRSTIAAMAVLAIGARLLAFTGAGLMFDGELWLICLLLAPAAGLGLYCGHRMHLRISRAQMLRAIFVMLLVSGSSLLARALLR